MKKMLFLIMIAFCSVPVSAQWSLELETGLAFQSYNDVRIPNEGGTEFSFTDDFDVSGPVVPIRLRLTYTLARRNHFSALFAPLSVNYEGPAPFEINFQDAVFNRGDFIEGLYKFNSYRFTYRYDILDLTDFTLGLGLTAKIRDARIELSSLRQTSFKEDFGFVPLINFFAEYRSWVYSIRLEGDALAADQGRAFDVALTGIYSFTSRIHMKAGYRVVEGGSDSDEVYNFSLTNFAVIGIIWNINL